MTGRQLIVGGEVVTRSGKRIDLVSEKNIEATSIRSVEVTVSSVSGIAMDTLESTNSASAPVLPLNYAKSVPVVPAKDTKWKKKGSDLCQSLPISTNRHMGGVDRMDENISKYRIGIRGKKWWWSIFTWCLNAAVNNAWRLSSNFRQQSNLEFRRELVQSYLKTYGEPAKGGGRQRVGMKEEGDSRVKNSVRYDNMGHFVVEAEKRRRCAGVQCKAVRTTMCSKCNVGLCVTCFKPFRVQ